MHETMGTTRASQDCNVSIIECAATGARVNSPRTLEACRRLGIMPSELLPKTIVEFKSKEDNHKFSIIEHKAAELRHGHYEQQRQHKLAIVQAERAAIVKGLGPAPPSTALCALSSTDKLQRPGFSPRRVQSDRCASPTNDSPRALIDSTILQREEHRLARMKLRQQKEMEKALDMETKLARLWHDNARRAAEDARREEDQQRKLRTRRMQLAAAKQEKELAKKREEDDHVLAQKAKWRADAERERILAEKAQEQARVRAAEAARRDVERQENAEAWRAHTAKLLKQQEDAVAENRRRMEAKERQVALRMESTTKWRHQEALERREKAAARLEKVACQNEAALARTRKEAKERQDAAAERARALQQKMENDVKEQAAKAKQEELVRQQRLERAYAVRQKHVKGLIAKRKQLEAKQEVTQQEREKTRLLAQVERQLAVTQREHNVARIQRMEAYAREQLVRRIASADAQSLAVKERKQALRQARQQVSVEAMVRRHQLAEAVEKRWTMPTTGNKSTKILYGYQQFIPALGGLSLTRSVDAFVRRDREDARQPQLLPQPRSSSLD